MKILVYDVETANNKNIGSICAIGWVLFEDDLVTSSGYTLINPCCDFSSTNIKVHGIRPEDVKNAPTFYTYWNTILRELMTTSIVVSHSAAFDLSATEQALFNASLEDPGIIYIDSLSMFRTLFSTESYKLCDLAIISNYQYQQHNALEDAKALSHVLLFIRNALNFSELAEMIIKSCTPAKNTLENNYVPYEIHTPVFSHNSSSRCRENVDVCDHLLAGKRFCFTGEISGYDRADLERIIKQHDGRMTAAVSGKTDYLVVGTYEEYGNSYISGKKKTALEIIENGGKIQIITPNDFFHMLEGT